jgi:hypothetical protein
MKIYLKFNLTRIKDSAIINNSANIFGVRLLKFTILYSLLNKNVVTPKSTPSLLRNKEGIHNTRLIIGIKNTTYG